MGLIGCIISPIHRATEVTLMSPLHFIQRPIRWLEAFARYGATHTAAPTFALDLCARKIRPAQRDALDLRRWQVLFVGAEPVRQESIVRFRDFFAPCGLQARTLIPCYGLAEGTLIAAGNPRHQRKTVRSYASDRLQPVRSVELVSCGQACETLRVVDPDTRRVRPPLEVGEIWLSGPSVSPGYHELPEESARTFGATLEGDPHRYLRTGDLGFLDESGELFVTGRLKDLIIVRGRKLYPQDLEATVERAAPDVRTGCSCAFAVPVEGEERVVVAAELRKDAAPAQVETTVREAVCREHDVVLHALVFLEANGLPKTSSGKLQRRATRAAFLDGKLEVRA
jgi:acyl-CoA synthetase (AMP-forming)/AMP-acid ligase II